MVNKTGTTTIFKTNHNIEWSMTMSKYSQTLTKKAQDIGYLDESEESLRKVMTLFRSCWDALTMFLCEHGYQGKIDDHKAKIQFIATKMKEHKVERPRKMNEWFTTMEKISEENAYRICFAFQLNLEQVKTFFQIVYLDRCFDCHQLKDAIYYYAFLHQYSYEQAKAIEKQCPMQEIQDLPEDIIYTKTIIERIEHIHSDEEFISFIKEHQSYFGYNNATATTSIQKIWKEISQKDGLYEQEKRLLGITSTTKDDSVWSIILQILGLDNIRGSQINAKRSLKPILVNNDLITSLAQDSFPSRNTLLSVLEGKHVSYRSVRKLLILFKFYQYWIKNAIKKHHEGEYAIYSFMATPLEQERCRYQMNHYLLDAGYHELYIGNPYDWIFLWAMKSENPLECLHSYFQLLQAVKSEEETSTKPNA